MRNRLIACQDGDCFSRGLVLLKSCLRNVLKGNKQSSRDALQWVRSVQMVTWRDTKLCSTERNYHRTKLETGRQRREMKRPVLTTVREACPGVPAQTHIQKRERKKQRLRRRGMQRDTGPEGCLWTTAVRRGSEVSRWN